MAIDAHFDESGREHIKRIRRGMQLKDQFPGWCYSCSRGKHEDCKGFIRKNHGVKVECTCKHPKRDQETKAA